MNTDYIIFYLVPPYLSRICTLYVKTLSLCFYIILNFLGHWCPAAGKNLKIIKFKIFLYFLKSHRRMGKMYGKNIMLKISIWNYLILNIIGKIRKFLRKVLIVNMVTWESSEGRINENYYTERHSNVYYEQLEQGSCKKEVCQYWAVI